MALQKRDRSPLNRVVRALKKSPYIEAAWHLCTWNLPWAIIVLGLIGVWWFFVFDNKYDVVRHDEDPPLAQPLLPSPSPKASSTVLGSSTTITVPGNTARILKEWTNNQYNRPDESGFFCPYLDGDYTSPEKWLKEKVPANFSEIRFKIQVRSNGSNEHVPAFITSLGKQTERLFRFFVGEGGKRVRFERYINSEKVEKIPAELDYALREGMIVEVRITSHVKDNKIRYEFEVSYVPSETNVKEVDNFSFDVATNDPSPENKLIDFGVGTYIGNCFKFLEIL